MAQHFHRCFTGIVTADGDDETALHTGGLAADNHGLMIGIVAGVVVVGASVVIVGA